MRRVITSLVMLATCSGCAGVAPSNDAAINGPGATAWAAWLLAGARRALGDERSPHNDALAGDARRPDRHRCALTPLAGHECADVVPVCTRRRVKPSAPAVGNEPALTLDAAAEQVDIHSGKELGQNERHLGGEAPLKVGAAGFEAGHEGAATTLGPSERPRAV